MFISDCETISHRLEKIDDGNYAIEELSPKAYRENNYTPRGQEYSVGYTRIRECDNLKCCGVQVDCSAEADNEQYSCRECALRNDISGCQNIPQIVAWLINNVLYADLEANRNDGKGVKSCSFGQIKAWCSSVCVHMHDVLKTVNNKNLVVGLEYYVDYRAENHVRADVVIGGYGSGHTKKMLVIELKQWTQVEIINDNNRWTWAFNNRSITNENPGTQCVEYTEKMRNAIIDNNNEHPIVFIPCVYMHNLEKEHITDSREESTIAYSNDDTIMTDEVITDGDKPVKFFLRGSDLSAYIDEVFDEESAIEVFKEYKKRHKTWSIPEIAAILTGNEEQQVRRMEDCLHWGQKKAYEALKTTLKNEN